MRKLISLIGLICISANAQIKVDEQYLTPYYQQVFEIDQDKADLKEKANAWLVKNYKNTNEGVKMNTESNLIVKGVFDVLFKDGLNVNQDGTIHYLLEISFKENKYRLTINNLYIEANNKEYEFMGKLNFFDHQGNMDKYIAQMKNNIIPMLPMGKKSALNRLNKKDKVEKDMQKQSKKYSLLELQIKTKLLSIAENLNNYIKNDDDW